MSPAAVTARLKRVAQLRRLCLALGKAIPIAPAPSASIPRPDGGAGALDHPLAAAKNGSA
jgi:hypothetical protein